MRCGKLKAPLVRGLLLLVALQKTPSLLGAECQGVGTTPLHANERGQTAPRQRAWSNRKVCSCYRTPSLLGDIYFEAIDKAAG